MTRNRWVTEPEACPKTHWQSVAVNDLQYSLLILYLTTLLGFPGSFVLEEVVLTMEFYPKARDVGGIRNGANSKGSSSTLPS